MEEFRIILNVMSGYCDRSGCGYGQIISMAQKVKYYNLKR